MVLTPRQFQSGMSGRMPSLRPQRTGVSPQLAHPHAPGTVAPTPPSNVNTPLDKAAEAAVARSQSNPATNRPLAMTQGPKAPAASPKRSTLGNATGGSPARLMKKGGLVRKKK